MEYRHSYKVHCKPMEPRYREVMIDSIIMLYKQNIQSLPHDDIMKDNLKHEPDYELLNIRDELMGAPFRFYCE